VKVAQITEALSNADREDMLATMKEFIARAEGRYVAGEAQKGETP
jgi:hypothetical protein